MGLLQLYATYRYGKKKGERKLAEAVQYVAFKEKEKQREKKQELKCPDCGWELFRHGPAAECPEYL